MCAAGIMQRVYHGNTLQTNAQRVVMRVNTLIFCCDLQQGTAAHVRLCVCHMLFCSGLLRHERTALR